MTSVLLPLKYPWAWWQASRDHRMLMRGDTKVDLAEENNLAFIVLRRTGEQLSMRQLACSSCTRTDTCSKKCPGSPAQKCLRPKRCISCRRLAFGRRQRPLAPLITPSTGCRSVPTRLMRPQAARMILAALQSIDEDGRTIRMVDVTDVSGQA